MQFRKDIPETGGGSKVFVKLKDKESIEGIFRGEPHEFFIKWEGGKSSVVDEHDPDAKFRFRINFVVKEGSVYVPKVFEQGITTYRLLGELNEEYGLDGIVCKITRNGTGTDTTYSILPLLKKQISKEVLAHLETIKLNDLSTEKSQPTRNSEGEEIPF